MGQYKGKRETPRQENGIKRWKADENANQKQPVDDPFAQDKMTAGERFENLVEDIGYFFRSKKGKIITLVFSCTLALVIGGVVAVKGWIKPPELPSVGEQGGTNIPVTGQDQPNANTNTNMNPEPQGPTDDELYPDDGYGGDMPEVSGERKEGFYTFLLVGTDRDDGNTDTIMVVSYDTVNQKVNVMSIPRDTMINESWDIKKINSVYSRTGYSINALANRVKKLVGFKPDFYVKVELSMFVELVDLVDGVDFYVPQDMKYSDPYQDLYIDLKEGQQTLDGEKAMQLVRFRGYADGDIKRVEVQQDFLKALIKECLSLEHWGKIKAYIDLALDHVETDLDFGSVVWFAANVLGLNDPPMLDMSSVNTCTIPGNYWASTWSRATNQNQSYVTIYPNQTVKLVNESFNPYVQNVTAAMLDAMSILDNGDIASSTGSLKDTTHNAVMAVRRGEAYYDEEGNIVYGDPGGDPDGETDEPVLPGEGEENDPSAGGETTTDPSTGETDGPGGGTESGSGEATDPNTGAETDPGTQNETSGETGDEPTLPEEPSEPPSEEEDPDSEMPEWLRPRN